MSKVYGYGRLALANDEEMVEDIRLVDDYCQDHGLVVDRHFFDNGVSGLILNREQLNALIDVLRAGDIVIIKNLARLSRSMMECATVIDLIDKIGATLIIIN